jgi:hypothetical protein
MMLPEQVEQLTLDKKRRYADILRIFRGSSYPELDWLLYWPICKVYGQGNLRIPYQTKHSW